MLCYIFRLSLQQSQQNKQTNKQTIHLYLIRGTWQESTNQSARFVEWKSRYMTMWFIKFVVLEREECRSCWGWWGRLYLPSYVGTTVDTLPFGLHLLPVGLCRWVKRVKPTLHCGIKQTTQYFNNYSMHTHCIQDDYCQLGAACLVGYNHLVFTSAMVLLKINVNLL